MLGQHDHPHKLRRRRKFARAVETISRLILTPFKLKLDDNDGGAEIDEDFRLNVTTDRTGFAQAMQEEYKIMIRRAKDTAPPGGLTHDWVLTYEITSRFHNLVVQDKENLDGADVAAARRYYHDNGGKERDDGLRNDMLILVDHETIEHLAAAPSAEEMADMTAIQRAKVGFDHWIKVVETEPKMDDECDYLDEMSDLPESRRRIRLIDYFDIFFQLQHIGGISEIGAEGLPTYHPGTMREINSDNMPPWQLCDNIVEIFLERGWRQEIYGEGYRFGR